MSVVQALLAARAGTAPLILRRGADQWRGPHVRTAAGLEALVLSDGAGRPVGVALAAAEGPDWTASVTYVATGGDRALTLDEPPFIGCQDLQQCRRPDLRRGARGGRRRCRFGWGLTRSLTACHEPDDRDEHQMDDPTTGHADRLIHVRPMYRYGRFEPPVGYSPRPRRGLRTGQRSPIRSKMATCSPRLVMPTRV